MTEGLMRFVLAILAGVPYISLEAFLMAGDYRIFVGAFPEGETGVRIQTLREQLDAKTASITPPHVTLAGTYWRNGPAIPENESEAIDSLSLVARVVKPFDLVVGGVHSFLPQAAVIYLGVEKNDGLLAARRALLKALGGDKHGQGFTPHLTLAMRLARAASEALLDELARQRLEHAPLGHSCQASAIDAARPG